MLTEIEQKSDITKQRRYAETNLARLSDHATQQYRKGIFDELVPDYAF
ncbi:hypothetical protein [Salinimonas sediminis]|nr:hypothetical protein [Salinimonas sediminis]